MTIGSASSYILTKAKHLAPALIFTGTVLASQGGFVVKKLLDGAKSKSLVTICGQSDWDIKHKVRRRQAVALYEDGLLYAHLRIVGKPRFHLPFLTLRALTGGTDTLPGIFMTYM